jgi:short subunit dehydrogenase-like uncharacterized protein
MAGRIVVFGATGYTGALTVEGLVAGGARPVLAGRSADKLAALSDRYGGLETATADVSRPESVRALVERGDVLVSTVGPFSRLGGVAVEAALDAGAHYVDSTGESPFVRDVFEVYGPRAVSSGSVLLTAFGYDFVPGNLAAGLALRDAGERAVRVEVGYFAPSRDGSMGRGDMSSGTAATSVVSATSDVHRLREGRLELMPFGRLTRRFADGARQRPAALCGGSEPLALPLAFPQLRDVEVHLGWFGPATRMIQAGSYLLPTLARLPGLRQVRQRAESRALARSGQGPDEEQRSRSTTLVLAEAFDAEGGRLAAARLEGPNGYTLTGQFLGWAATRLSAGEVAGPGARGPVDAFGLGDLEAGCAGFGLVRSG